MSDASMSDANMKDASMRSERGPGEYACCASHLLIAIASSSSSRFASFAVVEHKAVFEEKTIEDDGKM